SAYFEWESSGKSPGVGTARTRQWRHSADIRPQRHPQAERTCAWRQDSAACRRERVAVTASQIPRPLVFLCPKPPFSGGCVHLTTETSTAQAAAVWLLLILYLYTVYRSKEPVTALRRFKRGVVCDASMTCGGMVCLKRF